MAILHDNDNPAFQLAADFINYSNNPLFLTGKAGTGKTTFLKYIRETCSKNMAVVAPTGVAAINAGGTTIHSFFQLPFTPFIPVNESRGNKDIVADKHSLLSRLRINTERKEVLQQLEVLIIDEISMVRCDVLDAIDAVLKHVRTQYNRPFGGVQVVLIGDLFQLPPVIKDEEWQLLSPYYSSPYFFSSHIITQEQPVYVELEKIYRQSDADFIKLLNQVRNNELDQHGIQLLESRYQPGIETGTEEGYITLSTHNEMANQVNVKKLGQLEEPVHSFNATVEGDFPEKSYPAEVSLNIKKGAQVMFIKNDVEKIRRYFNGKIGIVEKIETDKVWVRCADGSGLIEVKTEKWRNILYQVDKKTNQVEEEEIGSFTQYPLRLAWAITIHKSQGLTFEKAIIDAGAAFAPGQVYVALSRCVSLEGIVLRSPVNRQRLKTDERIVNFIASQKNHSGNDAALLVAKKQFQQYTIVQLFDMSGIERQASLFLKWFTEHHHHFNEAAGPWVRDIYERIVALNEVSKKFHAILETYFAEEVLPENNEVLVKRLQAASQHYTTHLDFIKLLLVKNTTATDSRPASNAGKEKLEALYGDIDYKVQLLQSCSVAFTLDAYSNLKNSYAAQKPGINIYTGKGGGDYPVSDHPELYRSLRKLRDELCAEKNMPVYMVCNTAGLVEMASWLPQTKEQLLQINGFGKTRVEKYGGLFLPVIRQYCEDNNLGNNFEAKPEKRVRKPKSESLKKDTRGESFDLYKSGKNVAEIAAERNLSVGTIENHLAHYIGLGELDINDFVVKDKQSQILAAAKVHGTESHKTLKENLPESISYPEIKMVLAGLEKVDAANEN